jgi:hypothetical protein
MKAYVIEKYGNHTMKFVDIAMPIVREYDVLLVISENHSFYK